MTNIAQASATPRDHFTRIIANWSYLGAPMRPSPDDAVPLQRVVANLGAAAHAVVLGLTPEIVGCDWPADVRLSAVDHSPQMIEALWPPAKGPANSEAILGDWFALPFEPGTIDLVVGDGCYMLLGHPDNYDNLSRSVRHALRPGGRFVIRVFLRPDQPESVDDIVCAYAAGEVGSVHALKMRLHGALHGTSGTGSRLDDLWQVWKTMPPLPAALAGVRGWSAEEITCIESYAGVDVRYYLPTLTEFRQSVGKFFDEVDCTFGTYEHGEHCPTFVFAKHG
jgi:SAM-dependent methyltransferase